MNAPKMKKQVDSLNNHIIICGYGRNGMQAAKKLNAYRKSFVVIEQDERLNLRCIKNHKISYQVLSKFNSLEKMLIKVKKESIVGFGSFINPYLYGEMSISRTARFFPATWIFKPFIIISAFFLFLYWKNNLNLFNEITNNNTLNKFSKNFFYLGLLSSIFLALHAIFLGIKFDNQLFEPFRRLVITLFIFFEVLASKKFWCNRGFHFQSLKISFRGCRNMQ